MPAGTTTSIRDAIFRFNTLRPVTFTTFIADRSWFTVPTTLTFSQLTMRDWMFLDMPGQSVALQGAAPPPPAARTISTGSLTGARMVATPATSTAPARIVVNGVTR